MKRASSDADASNDIHSVADVDLKMPVPNDRTSVTGCCDLSTSGRVLFAALENRHGPSGLRETKSDRRPSKARADHHYIEFLSNRRFVV